jgi:hypothetical protein
MPMLNDDEGPHDWEIKDEEPPGRLQKKWENEEASGLPRAVCISCKKETPSENLTCLYCGAVLPKKYRAVLQPEAPKTPWYAKTVTLVISFLTVGPFALLLVWFNPVYSRRKKIIVTVIVLAVTATLVAVFIQAVRTIVDYYKQAGIF